MNRRVAEEIKEGKEMLPLVTYEMIRQMDEERRARSMKRFWWRHLQPETDTATPIVTRDADVIELVFGARCDAEEPIGA
jgi:hypothetical protein